RIDERLGAVVDRVEAARHEAGNRAGDEDPAAAAGAHLAADLLDQVDGAGDVGVDDVAHFVEVLVEESAAEALAGVGEKRLDRAAARRVDELVDAVAAGEIDLERLDLDTEPAQVLGRLLDLGAVGGDEQV